MMNAVKSYITFLKEYKKLLERGVKDILASNNSSNFIWMNDIENLVDAGGCTSVLPEIFSSQFAKTDKIFVLEKPLFPNVIISGGYSDHIFFDLAKNSFASNSSDEEQLRFFLDSDEGIIANEKLKVFKRAKDIYSKFFRAYNDIKNDTNLEVVLSVGFVQYSKKNNSGNISKTNQHLFHFPLTLDISAKNSISLKFSESAAPYVDFFFLNNAPIEKEVLTNIVDVFNARVEEIGFEYIYQESFRELIENDIEKISDCSIFESSVLKPSSDIYKEDHFRVSFSPAINIKYQKPRFFERLTDSIIEYNDLNQDNGALFNFLVRDPKAAGQNTYPKPNYFIDELFEGHKENLTSLGAEEDFSVFFPLPYNDEQRSIYRNYLKNRLTVVAGPPGTGKSHTIVNILCALLAQGKRVLVTAQTDKALESLLTKIPKNFDDLIFTKIELENNKARFSLENSIERLTDLLTKSFFTNIENKLLELDKLKGQYVKEKSAIVATLEAEYSNITINTTFSNLRPFQIAQKFLDKNPEEFSWMKDDPTNFANDELIALKDNLVSYQQFDKDEIPDVEILDVDFDGLYIKLRDLDFSDFLQSKKISLEKSISLGLNEVNKSKLIKLDLDRILELTKDFTNSDMVLRSTQELDRLSAFLDHDLEGCDFTTNKSYSEIIGNYNQYLLDIETYKSLVADESVPFLTRFRSVFKRVAYLEDFTIDGKKCNSLSAIRKLKVLIEKISVLDRNFKLLKDHGFVFILDDRANVAQKIEQLIALFKQIDRNKQLLNQTRLDPGLVNFAKFTGMPIDDIDNIREKAILYKEDFLEMAALTVKISEVDEILIAVNMVIERSKKQNLFTDYLPLNTIDNILVFDRFLSDIEGLNERLTKHNEYRKAKQFLFNTIPKTFPALNDLNPEYVTQENIDYAATHQFLLNSRALDLQVCTQNLSRINKEISNKKCDILFDLARSNFKQKFEYNEIDTFINLLKEYKYNLGQSTRKIREQVKYQILCRKNSIAISKKLSCWVMKFNDVLNSVGHEPEIFDCIIVDEASQLDFNSLILGYYGKNMIIVGDDKQTSPTSLTAADGNDFESIKNKYLEFLGPNIIHIKSDNSLFNLSEMIAGTSNLTLKEHFRCVPELIEFSRSHFYNNSLRPLKQLNSNRLTPKKALFVDNAISEDNVVSMEIRLIKEHLKSMLVDPKYKTKSIGVVSLGYASHTEKLKDVKEDLVAEFGLELIDSYQLIIEDSPKFQGDERDVMLVSLGVGIDYEAVKNGKNGKPTAIITDEDKRRKINVALSRAKEQMILFHSVKSEDLAAQDFRKHILSFFYSEVKTVEPLVLDSHNVQRDRYNVPVPFDSWFEFDIARNLIGLGYDLIQPQYKVKEDEKYYNHKLSKDVFVNFKIDLVVFNRGKAIAIECDGDPFHSLPEDISYDIERQEFLERVGWKVYRILYSAFKRNPSKEVGSLVDFIQENTQEDVFF